MSASTLTLTVVLVAFLILGAALVVAFVPLLDQVNDAVSAIAR